MWRSRAGLALALGLAACGSGDEGRRAPAPAAAPEAADGRVVYETRCAPCHGVDGRGDGPAAATITPKPRNFSDPDFWKGRSADQLRLVVRQGKPGTLMPPFEGALDKDQIDAVVAYIERFRS